MAAQSLESVRRALAQQDAAVDRFKAIVQENSALNERILEHEDTIARQAAELSTLRSEADDTMSIQAAQTAARPRVTFLVNIWLNHRPLGIASNPAQ